MHHARKKHLTGLSLPFRDLIPKHRAKILGRELSASDAQAQRIAATDYVPGPFVETALILADRLIEERKSRLREIDERIRTQMHARMVARAAMRRGEGVALASDQSREAVAHHFVAAGSPVDQGQANGTVHAAVRAK